MVPILICSSTFIGGTGAPSTDVCQRSGEAWYESSKEVKGTVEEVTKRTDKQLKLFERQYPLIVKLGAIAAIANERRLRLTQNNYTFQVSEDSISLYKIWSFE